MPIYEYKCDGCGEVFEVLQCLSDPPPATHEACGSTSVHRVMSAAAFVFKGDGWYITDYARKGKDGESGGGKKSKDKGGSGSSGGGESSGSSSSSSGGSSSGSSSSGGSSSGSSSGSSGKTAAA